MKNIISLLFANFPQKLVMVNLYHSLGLVSRQQADTFFFFRKQDLTFPLETVCKNNKNVSICHLLKIVHRVLILKN